MQIYFCFISEDSELKQSIFNTAVCAVSVNKRERFKGTTLTLNTEKFYRCADITKDYIIKMHL